jgi:MoaA/NifB/PqqE/SkfB family radical SAM enzyme
MGSSRKKPDPYNVGAFIDLNQEISGLGYIWATTQNVDAIKNGNYGLLNPVAAEFDLSTKCVYQCPWCAYRDSKKSEGAILQDPRTAIQVVENLSKSGIRLLVLTGGGEPLLSCCVEEVIRKACKCKMDATLYTNGYLLSEKRSKKILSSGVSEIRVSLNDVSCQEAFDTAHGTEGGSAPSVTIILRNLVSLLKLRKDEKYKPNIGVSFVLLDNSAENLDQSLHVLESKLREHNVLIDYTLIRPAVDYWPNKRIGYSRYLGNPLFALEKAKKAQAKFSDSGVLGKILISADRFTDLVEEEKGPKYPKCLASNIWMNIGPDATVYFCCETKHISEFAMGNILNQGFSMLTNSGIARQMRETSCSTSICPTRLCKPSEQNRIFNEIESHRDKNTGILPSSILFWLNEMASWNQLSGKSQIPSIAGRYLHYQQEVVLSDSNLEAEKIKGKYDKN